MCFRLPSFQGAASLTAKQVVKLKIHLELSKPFSRPPLAGRPSSRVSGCKGRGKFRFGKGRGEVFFAGPVLGGGKGMGVRWLEEKLKSV